MEEKKCLGLNFKFELSDLKIRHLSHYFIMFVFLKIIYRADRGGIT